MRIFPFQKKSNWTGSGTRISSQSLGCYLNAPLADGKTVQLCDYASIATNLTNHKIRMHLMTWSTNGSNMTIEYGSTVFPNLSLSFVFRPIHIQICWFFCTVLRWIPITIRTHAGLLHAPNSDRRCALSWHKTTVPLLFIYLSDETPGVTNPRFRQ